MNHKISGYTWVGILISMFSITVINLSMKALYGPILNNLQMITKELIILGVTAFLLFYIIPKEKLNLDSIGLHARNIKKNWLWIFGLLLICIAGLAICLLVCKWLGWPFGESKSFDKLSPWVITLVTLRAGISEEVFMRGFLLERFTTITGKKWIAFLLSTLPFGFLHYPQGYAGILIATVAGGILALFYFWKRDLIINIIAHFLVDFIPNVVLPMFG